MGENFIWQKMFFTGTGREMALGFNFVLRYLEQGDTVFVTYEGVPYPW